MSDLIFPPVTRKDYKAVKHMDRDALTKYIYRVYSKGFDDGVASTKGKITKCPSPTPDEAASEE